MTDLSNTPDQAERRPRRAAVPLSPVLERALASYAGLSQVDPQWSQLGRDDARWGALCADLRLFTGKLAAVMLSLPETPRRGSAADPNPFWSAAIPVQESMKVLRRLSYLYAMGWRYRENDFTMAPSALLVAFKDKYGKALGKFERLDRWLYRRTPRGKSYQKGYDASPQARARRVARNTTDFRQREADRKRTARAESRALKASLRASGEDKAPRGAPRTGETE